MDIIQESSFKESYRLDTDKTLDIRFLDDITNIHSFFVKYKYLLKADGDYIEGEDEVWY